jgi:hypothetical protein
MKRSPSTSTSREVMLAEYVVVQGSISFSRFVSSGRANSKLGGSSNHAARAEEGDHHEVRPRGQGVKTLPFRVKL